MRRYLITILCIGNLLGCLFYLGINDELKYDYVNTWIILTNPVSYGSACAALFFGMYMFYGAIALIYVRTPKNKLDDLVFNLHGWFLFVSGVLYTLHYLEILSLGSKERMGYIVGFLIVVYLRDIYNHKRQEE